MTDLLLLSKDTPIAQIINGTVQPILPERLPLFLQRFGDALAWLASRAIDSHRTNSRLLKRALRLESRDDLTAVLSVNAVTITDNYWVKPLDDTTTRYADVRYKVNRFDNLALTGDANSFDQPPERTPELTNTGSYEKCWRLVEDKGNANAFSDIQDIVTEKNTLQSEQRIERVPAGDARWWMIKDGRPEELFSELLISRIAEVLGFPVARYAPEGNFIKSRDFTDNASVDFESAAGISGETVDYIKIYEALKPFGEQITDRYLQMCYLDALVFNMDRHENNFGVLRDSDTGKVLSLAPFFDHNIALVSRNYPLNVQAENDRLITDFTELARYAQRPMRVHELTKTDFEKLVREIPWELPMSDTVDNPRQFVVQYLLNRQARLKELNRETVIFQIKKPKNRDAQ